MECRRRSRGDETNGVNCGSGRRTAVMGGGKMRVALLVALLAAIVVPSALAASPQQIYADLADNGRLDSQYSDADLQTALRSAVVQAYGEGSVQEELEGALAGESSGGGG